MRHNPLVCSCCGRVIDQVCQLCRQRYQQRMRDLTAMPGHPIMPELKLPPKLTKDEKKILHTYRQLRTELVKALDVAIGINRAHAPTERERCSGNTAIWKDDESGASSGWDSVVRAYEDMDLEESTG